MATIYDVADVAGVSAKTVSRVLNEDKAVRLNTRERVLAAMARLDYRPNAQARNLRTGAQASIGLLLEDPMSGYQSRFHHAMLIACMEVTKYLAVELYASGPDWQDKVMHATLLFGNTALMGSDTPPPHNQPVQGFSLSLSVDKPEDADRVFAALAEGGKIQMPINPTFWSARFGMLIDQFGSPWMVNCNQAPA